jgi:hypothetical protein
MREHIESSKMLDDEDGKSALRILRTGERDYVFVGKRRHSGTWIGITLVNRIRLLRLDVLALLSPKNGLLPRSKG